jgi:hypothetical protein
VQRRRRRWPFILAGVLAFFAAAVAIVYEPFLRKMVREQALAHGVELRCATVSYRLGTLALGGCVARLAGIDGIEVGLGNVDVDLAGVKPLAVHARGVDADLTGDARVLVPAVQRWLARHPSVRDIAVEAEDVRVAWLHAVAERDVSVKGASATVEPGGRIGSVRMQRLTVSGIELGPAAAQWDDRHGAARFALGETLDTAPLVVTASFTAPPHAQLALAKMPVARLAARFGASLPVDKLIAGMRIDARFGARPLEDEITGKLAAEFDGYLPPHPAEIDPFLHGTAGTVTSNFTLSADRAALALRDVELTLGSIVLRGTGDVRRVPNDVDIAASLRGSLACATLADIVVTRQIGGPLGSIAGDIAASGITGGVTFGFDFAAHAADLSAAKLTPVVGLGCGIKSLDRLIPALAGQLPKLLPSDLPEIRLPTVPFLPRL